MKNYLRSWTFVRALRLGMGIVIVVQGIHAREWLFVALGGLFSLTPLLNVGCCGASGCGVPVLKSDKKPGDATCEEIR